MAALRGVVIGDSQIKFLERDRLRLVPSVQVCTFSFPGASTRTLPGEVGRLHLHATDFVAVYVGGNDLYGGDSAEAISSRIEELVTTLKGLTSHVLVFKLVPRGGPLGHARESERLSLNSLLVRKLVVLGVTIVNVDHLFLSRGNVVNLEKLAVDRYHVCRVRGIQCIAFALSKALAKLFGRSILGGCRAAFRRFRVHRCGRCGACGHWRGACLHFAALQH
ncbi:uncharacterized protein ISCGN_019755 [Ixodes scapularis]